MIINQPTSLLILVLATFSLIYAFAFLLQKRPPVFYGFISSFGILSLTAIAGFFHFNRLADYLPQCFGLITGLLLGVGPASYFFIKKTLHPARPVSYLELIHAAPLIIYVVSLQSYWTLDAKYKIDFINRSYADGFWNVADSLIYSPRPQYLAVAILCFLYFGYSVFVLIDFLRKAGHDVKVRNSTLLFFLKSDLAWKILLSLTTGTFLILNIQETFILVLIGSILTYLLWMSFLMIRSPEILLGLRPVQPVKNSLSRLPEILVKHTEPAPVSLKPQVADDPESEDEPYTPTDQSKQLFARIESYMQTEKPFLDENFSRIGLADKMIVPPRKVTLTIHGETNFNFADYVNSYRIRHIEEQLANGSEWRLYSVERLAKEGGFNTRAAFNNALRRLRNVTPSELLRTGS